MNEGKSDERKLGWNWIWFLPLCLVVLLFVEGHVVAHAFRLAKLAHQRWSWGALISPSAYFCVGVITTSILLPLYGLASISAVFKSEDETSNPKRFLFGLTLAIVIFVLPFVTDALTWGSFPFNIDDHGVARMRLVPFVPWPDGQFGEY